MLWQANFLHLDPTTIETLNGGSFFAKMTAALPKMIKRIIESITAQLFAKPQYNSAYYYDMKLKLLFNMHNEMEIHSLFHSFLAGF